MNCERCGQPTVSGRRYEATQTVDVHLCLDCGWETPPYGACCKRPRTAAAYGCCETCAGPLTAQQRRFCSVSCHGLMNRKARVERVCPCGHVFEVTLAYLERPRKGLYCSKACQSAYRKAAWGAA